MPALQRSIAVRGPRFFMDGEHLMFVRHLDASTREGPRKATPADKKAYADAWDAYQAAEAK